MSATVANPPPSTRSVFGRGRRSRRPPRSLAGRAGLPCPRGSFGRAARPCRGSCASGLSTEDQGLTPIAGTQPHHLQLHPGWHRRQRRHPVDHEDWAGHRIGTVSHSRSPGPRRAASAQPATKHVIRESRGQQRRPRGDVGDRRARLRRPRRPRGGVGVPRRPSAMTAAAAGGLDRSWAARGCGRSRGVPDRDRSRAAPGCARFPPAPVGNGCPPAPGWSPAHRPWRRVRACATRRPNRSAKATLGGMVSCSA
jgi:hypothetical protein